VVAGTVAGLADFGRIPLTVLGALPELVVGTGSVVTEALLHLAAKRATGASARFLVLERTPTYIDESQATSEVVNTIRSSFGLSVTDLATVLGVERPTVYSWLKDQSTPAAARLERMDLVLRLADTWTASAGGGYAPDLTAAVSEGVSLLAALRAPTHWESEIIANLTAQAAAVSKRRGMLVSVTSGQGADARPSSDFDIATGRPLAPES
jgi:transcriptional regulator with XRE-family HTH domain